MHGTDQYATQMAMGMPSGQICVQQQGPTPMLIAEAVPAGAVPLQAIPMATAVPVQAHTLMMPQSAPMHMHGHFRYEMKVNLYSKISETTRQTIPQALQLRGVTGNEWDSVCTAIDTFQHANFFYDCPNAELMWWCCPGGPIQWVLCMFNPISCAVCIAPMEKAKESCIRQVSLILGPKGMKMEFDFLLDKAIFTPA